MIITDFVARMDLAYSIADLVVSRAGASSISELSLLQNLVFWFLLQMLLKITKPKNALAFVGKECGYHDFRYGSI